MTDRRTEDTPPETFADLPMQPTGSGVADLQTAYEQMELSHEAEDAPAEAIDREAVAEAEAHPS